MGLDMYLSESVNLSHYPHSEGTDEYATAEQALDLTGITPEPGGGSVEVKAVVLNWRKANAVHRWFVENVQLGKDDCGTYYVDDEDLKKLSVTAQQALDHKEYAGAYLPTQEGFFYGSTEYDEWYFEGLEATVAGVARVLRDKIARSSFEYSSSW